MSTSTINRLAIGVVLGAAAAYSAAAAPTNAPPPAAGAPAMTDRVVRTESEWKARLTPEQYRVTRLKGTERAFTGAFWNHHEPGVYRCVGCGAELFVSDHKFDSGCGWPSFFQPATGATIGTSTDHDVGYARTEVHCDRCGAHLGHVFHDGPQPTGLRYCINSASLAFDQKAAAEGKTSAPPPASPKAKPTGDGHQ